MHYTGMPRPSHDRDDSAAVLPVVASAMALSTTALAAIGPIKAASLPVIRPSEEFFYMYDYLHMVDHNHLSVRGSDTTRAMPVLIYRAIKCRVNTLRARRKPRYTDKSRKTMVFTSVSAIGPGEIERPMGKHHDWTQDWDFIFPMRNRSEGGELWVADACLYFNGLSTSGCVSIPWDDRSSTQKIEANILPSKHERKGLKEKWLEFTWKFCERSDCPRWGGQFYPLLPGRWAFGTGPKPVRHYHGTQQSLGLPQTHRHHPVSSTHVGNPWTPLELPILGCFTKPCYIGPRWSIEPVPGGLKW